MGIEKITQQGTLTLAPGEPVRIDPALLLPGGSRVAPSLVTVEKGMWLDTDTNQLSPTFGTFRIQNITSGVVSCRWVATFEHSTQLRSNAALQAGVGPLGLQPAPPALSLLGALSGPMPNVLFINANSPAGVGDGSVAAPYALFTEAAAFIATQPFNQQWALCATGTFIENPVLPPAQSYIIVGENFFTIDGDLTIQKDATNETEDPLFIFFRYQVSGDLRFLGTGPASNTILVAFFGNVGGGILSVGDIGVVILPFMQNCQIAQNLVGDAINHPGLILLACDSVDFGGLVSCQSISKPMYSSFQDIEVTAEGLNSAPNSFINCVLNGDFTGPVNSFRVDEATQRSFSENGGALLGGATVVQTGGRSSRIVQVPETVPGPALAWTDIVNGFIDVDSDSVAGLILPEIFAQHNGQRVTVKRRLGTAAVLGISGTGQPVEGLGVQPIGAAGGSLELIADFSIPGWSIVASH